MNETKKQDLKRTSSAVNRTHFCIVLRHCLPVPKSRKLIITVSSQWMQKRTQEIISSKQREIFIYTIQLPSEITSSIEKSEALTQVWTKISSAISKCTKLMHMNLSTQNINSNSFQTYIITWPVSPTKWTLRGAIIQRLQIRKTYLRRNTNWEQIQDDGGLGHSDAWLGLWTYRRRGQRA